MLPPSNHPHFVGKTKHDKNKMFDSVSTILSVDSCYHVCTLEHILLVCSRVDD